MRGLGRSNNSSPDVSTILQVFVVPDGFLHIELRLGEFSVVRDVV